MKEPLLADAARLEPATESPQTHDPDESALRLLIFGDSWASPEDPNVRPWPELLGLSLGWPTLNVAEMGSASTDLNSQSDRLLHMLRATGRKVHADAWVVIHTGGNDLVMSGSEDVLKLSCQVLCDT